MYVKNDNNYKSIAPITLKLHSKYNLNFMRKSGACKNEKIKRNAKKTSFQTKTTRSKAR